MSRLFAALFDPGLVLAAIVVAFLAAVAALADDDTAGVGAPDPHDDDDGAAFRVWPGLGVGAKSAGTSTGPLGVPQLSFSLPLLSIVEADVTAGLGVQGGAFDLESAELINRFSFGLRWFLPVEGLRSTDVDSPVRPLLWTAVHHGHKVSLQNAGKSPIAALLTSTDAGVSHLTGLEGGAGLLFGLPIDGRSYPLLLRAGASWLPAFASHHEGGPHKDDVLVVVDVSVGLPVAIDEAALR